MYLPYLLSSQYQTTHMNLQLEHSPYARSTISNSSRREVLWNVLEPGDPYDIRKSMIAKIPGDKKIFMGDHLELVCLLQSAEIERITEFLDDYKLKFREIDRSKLDRHSYQIQIKELTQKLAQEESIRLENSKLKDFVKKQSAQLDSTKKDSRDYRSIDEKSFEKISQLLMDNQHLQEVNEQYKLQIQSFNVKIEAIEKGHLKEIEDLKLNIAQYSRQSYQASISTIRFQNESQIKQIQFELNRIKQNSQQKTNEILALQQTNKELQSQVTTIRMQGGNQANFDRYIFDLQNKIKFINQQNERLIVSVRDLSNKCEESEFRWREASSKNERLQLELREREIKLQSSLNQSFILKESIGRLQVQAKKVDESSHYLNQYEQKINNLLRENQQLIAKVGYHGNLERKLKEEIDRLAYEGSRYKLIENQNNVLKQAGHQNSNLQRRLAELQNLYNFSNKQIERLSNILRGKDQQLEKYRNILIENDNLKNKIREVQFGLSGKYESEINRLRIQYESRLNHQNAMTDNQFQSRAQVYQREVEKLKEIVRAKGQETQRLRAQIYQIDIKFNRAEVENSIKIKNQESNISSLRRNNEELNGKVRQMIEGERKFFEIQQNHIQLQREYERLLVVIKNKEDETSILKNKLKEIEAFNQKNEQEIRTKAVVFEKKIQNLKNENEELKKKVFDMMNELNRRSNQFLQEANRLKRQAAINNEQKIQIDGKLKQALQQNEQIKQYLKKSTLEGEDLRKKIIELQGKLAILFNESSATIRNLSIENQSMKRYLNETKSSVNNYQLEASRKVINYEQNLAQLKRENEDLRKLVKGQQNKIYNSIQQIDKLSILYKTKTQEASFIEANYHSLGKQYENIKNYLKENESAANAKFVNYDQTILTIIQESEQIKQKMLQQNDYLRKIVVQRQTALANTELQLNRRTANFENSLKNVNRINEEQQKRLNDNDILIRSKMEDIIRLENTINILNQHTQANRRKSMVFDVSSPSRSETESQQNFAFYEQNISKLNREIEELKLKLQQKGTECSFIMQSSQSQLINSKIQNERIIIKINEMMVLNESIKREYETNLQIKQNETQQLIQNYQRKIQENSHYCEELQKKINQSEELILHLKESEERAGVLSDNIDQITASLKQIDEENEYLKSLLGQYKISDNRVDALDTSKEDLAKGLASANAEIERLISKLHEKQGELYQTKVQVDDQNCKIDFISQQLSQVELRFKQTMEIQMVDKCNSYELKISDLIVKCRQLDSNHQNALQEIDRMTQILEQKDSQLQDLHSSLINIQKENENSRRSININDATKINQQAIDNEELHRIISELSTKNASLVQFCERGEREMTELESKNQVLRQDLFRLQQYMKAKQDELNALISQFNQYEESVRYTLQIQVNNRYNQYEHHISDLVKEIENLKISQGESSQSAQQKDKYEKDIQSLISERDLYNSALQGQIEDMTRILKNYKQLEYQNLQIKKKLSESEFIPQNRAKDQRDLTRQKPYLQEILRQKNEELKINEQRLSQFKQQIAQLRIQKLALQRNVSNKSRQEDSNYQLSLSLSTIIKQRDSLLKIQRQNEAKLALLTQQYQRISMLYKLKNDEFQKLKKTTSQPRMRYQDNSFSFRANPNDLQSAKKHLLEYQISIRKLYAQFDRLQRIIDDLKREKSILTEKNINQNNQLIRLIRENKELQDHSKAIQLKLSDEATIFRQGNKAMSMFVAQPSVAAVLNSRIQEQNESKSSIGSLPSFK